MDIVMFDNNSENNGFLMGFGYFKVHLIIKSVL